MLLIFLMTVFLIAEHLKIDSSAETFHVRWFTLFQLHTSPMFLNHLEH